jgi:hypothetical protein
MWYFIVGLLAGAMLTLVPVWTPAGGTVLTGEWHGTLKAPADIERSGNPEARKAVFASLPVEDTLLTFSGTGAVLYRNAAPGKLLSGSGSGRFYATYEKTGSHIELFGAKGERFWKLQSAEYPHLSYNGELVLLVNADMSQVRLFDHNGNVVGAGGVSGRFITSFAFSRGSDHAGIGFLDGSYAVVSKTGEITAEGRTPDNAPVKSVALSDDGTYAAMHCGGEKGDRVIIINTIKHSEKIAKLTRTHVARIGMHITPEGRLAVIDGGRIALFTRRGNPDFMLEIPREKAGIASIAHAGDVYAVSYPRADGDAQFVVFTDEGDVLLSKACAGESFLYTVMDGPFILARGSQGLYCYSVHLPAR